MAGKGWTPERRAAQRKAIHRWRPWEKSTGPKTTEGKDRVARNALKHGSRSKEGRRQLKALRDMLREFGAPPD